MGSVHYLQSVPLVPKAETACLDTFDRELDYLFWTLQRLGARADDTDDLLQDIFVVLHRNWPTLDTTRPLRPWLFGVAFRVVKTYRRRQARETPRDGLDPTDAAPNPEDLLQSQEALALLTAALQRVPEARRSALVLHDLDGVEVGEDRSAAGDHEVRGVRQAPQGTEGAGFRGPLAAKGAGAQMKRRGTVLDPELATLLELRKVERRIPPEARTRVLARCRAVVLWGEAFTRLPPPNGPRSFPAPVGRGSGLARLALAASIAIVAGAVGAIAALRGRAADDPPAALTDRPLPVTTAILDEPIPAPAPEPLPVAIQHAVTAKAARAPRGADPFTAEVELLQRAHLAYARRDFSGALALVQEHARRFPKGPLAEEREALRVESLVGAGLADEASRRAAVFAARFPRSVLLPRVEAASKDQE